MTDLTNTQKLTAAREAYHKLLTGAQRVTVRDGDTMVEYTPANQSNLKTYIGELELLVAAETNPTKPKRRPAGVTF